jgi:hypothetical protein
MKAAILAAAALATLTTPTTTPARAELLCYNSETCNVSPSARTPPTAATPGPHIYLTPRSRAEFDKDFDIDVYVALHSGETFSHTCYSAYCSDRIIYLPSGAKDVASFERITKDDGQVRRLMCLSDSEYRVCIWDSGRQVRQHFDGTYWKTMEGETLVLAEWNKVTPDVVDR